MPHPPSNEEGVDQQTILEALLRPPIPQLTKIMRIRMTGKRRTLLTTTQNTWRLKKWLFSWRKKIKVFFRLSVISSKIWYCRVPSEEFNAGTVHICTFFKAGLCNRFAELGNLLVCQLFLFSSCSQF